jgi:GTP cyclohydrolase IIa
VGSRDGYAFFTRLDNIVAVTNGMDFDDHALIQESIGNWYPVTVSLSVATDSSPVQALSEATEALQVVGSAQANDRREALCGRSLPDDTRTDDDVQIAHFDIIGVTERYTDELNAIDALIRV